MSPLIKTGILVTLIISVHGQPELPRPNLRRTISWLSGFVREFVMGAVRGGIDKNLIKQIVPHAPTFSQILIYPVVRATVFADNFYRMAGN